MDRATPSLPYHEPEIVTILVQASFLLLLNVVNAALDRLLYCGLLGQVLVGIAWGAPGAKWLSVEMQDVVVQLGYLGLILLVYQGGVHTSFRSLKANLALSTCVALTGIIVPVGLSYTLQGLLDATPLQAFAAGASLCSTSLGTTFTVLEASGLSSSRIGVVLTSAAIMDDVVGLIMVQVISNLGGNSFNWVTIVRPILVSIGFSLVVPVFCLLVLKPITLRLNQLREARPSGMLDSALRKSQTAFVLHTALIVALVVGATYAGTSNLFAAYIAGATISWWDSELSHPTPGEPTASSRMETKEAKASGVTPRDSPRLRQVADSTGNSLEPAPISNATGSAEPIAQDESLQAPNTNVPDDNTSGAAIYQCYYQPAVSTILQPMFFASVGFSIPITRMFKGAIVWRGIVYTVLMAFGKFLCGIWLVRFTLPPLKTFSRRLSTKEKLLSVPGCLKSNRKSTSRTTQSTTAGNSRSTASAPDAPENQASSTSSPNPPKPFSLHPPLILALAMCARGEIGFLVSGVAESNGIFSGTGNASATGSSDIFLVVTWAIVLCTITGPLGVGLLVRRVKKLQKRKEEEQEGAGREVLGVWGMQ